MRLIPRPQRYCRECGERMKRARAYASSDMRFDPTTGRRVLVWYWACDRAFFGYSRKYLDGRPFHDATRIPRSGARRRLEHG